MDNQTLEEKNLKALLSENSFIIPEIQREYVWGNNEELLSHFLVYLKNKINNKADKKINIGFLYSYAPDHVKDSQSLDKNLIDGQQRLTTLFLLLFYLSLKEEKDFKSLIRFQENTRMNLTFSVRDVTRRFLLTMVEKTKTVEKLKTIKEQTWFLKDFENDVSIQAMLKTLCIINEVFNDLKTYYYEELLKQVVFWHFKTEATSQGEELYITMNARGESLANNEVKKASLMTNKDLFEWGKKWESWQQLFWKNRGENENADNGFNEFLSWCEEIDVLLKADDKFSKNGQFEKIELLFNAYKKLIDDVQDKPIEHHENILKIKAIFDFRELIQSVNKSISNEKKITLYSTLCYVINNDSNNELDLLDLYRFIRIVRNTAKHNSSMELKRIFAEKSSGFKQSSELLTNENSFISKEERLKLNIYEAHLDKRIEIEAAFWEAEEHNFFNFKIQNLINDNSLSDEYNHSIFLKLLETVKNHLHEESKIKDEFRFALLCIENGISHNPFYEGKSWGSVRFNIGKGQTSWRKIVQSELFYKLLSEMQHKSLEEIIEQGILNEPNPNDKKIKKVLVKQSKNYWQWNENKRFIYHENCIYFPNGSKANKNISSPIPII